MKRTAELLAGVRWLGRSGFLIQDSGLTVYIDPVGVPAGLPKADVVFLTHPHENHYSPADVEALSAAWTVVVGPKDCVARFRLNQMPLRPGDCREVLSLWVKPVAAYCPKEGSRHPRDHDWLGFFIQFRDTSIYLPGDSAYVPEMKNVHPDILLFPVRENGIAGADLKPFLEHAKPEKVWPYGRGRSAELAAACADLGLSLHESAPEARGGAHV